MDNVVQYFSLVYKCIIVYMIDMIPVDVVFLFTPYIPTNFEAWVFWLGSVKDVLLIIFTIMAIVSMPLLRKIVRIKRFKKVTKDLFEKVDSKDEISE